MLHNFQANFLVETQWTIPKEYAYNGTFFKPSDADTPLYSGFLAPAFVSCSTNLGEVLVKLTTCHDILGHWVDCGGATHSQNKQQVSEHTADHNDRPWSD